MKLFPSDPDIKTIANRIETGELNLQPDFQRGEVWSLSKKSRLIDSILRGWHIPPIHVVEKNASGLQEVLDGQQRLVSIRDFMENKFEIDGNIEPKDESIKSLDGKTYSTLPDEVKRKFDRFPLRIFTLTDYSASEPAELFYRLNQLTNLTPAEQRNAYYGKAREQVKELVNIIISSDSSDEKIGFSNSRMNYDDVIARFLVYIEQDTLAIKVTANILTDYYRSEDGFTENAFIRAHKVITFFTNFIEKSEGSFRFNKATLLSWLLFIYRSMKNNYSTLFSIDSLIMYVGSFERFRKVDNNSEFKRSSNIFNDLIKIYNDRATSRVADVSSVQLRDLILFIFATFYFNEPFITGSDIEGIEDYDLIDNVYLEEHLIELINSSRWSEL